MDSQLMSKAAAGLQTVAGFQSAVQNAVAKLIANLPIERFA
jgi:hypothetical protein